MNLAPNAYILDANHGALSAKHERIARIIQDYDPNLELAFIPKNARTAFDAEPFAIIHNMGSHRYVVMTCKEEEVDERLLAKLFMANQAVKGNDILGRLEAEEAARNLLRMRETMDEYEEKMDFAKSLIKTKKHRYKHNGKTYDS